MKIGLIAYAELKMIKKIIVGNLARKKIRFGSNVRRDPLHWGLRNLLLDSIGEPQVPPHKKATKYFCSNPFLNGYIRLIQINLFLFA